MITCIRTPHPALIAAWLLSPALRSRSLVLGGQAHERGEVLAASDMAMAQGVRVGMSLNRAQQFAPEAIFQPVDQEATARVRQTLLTTLHRISPDVAADADPGCAFLRIDRLALRWPDRSALLATLAKAVITALEVTPSIGVGDSMFVARLAAAQASPGMPLVVELERTAAFLARLPIDVLPLDDDLREYLELLGLRKIGALQRISRPAFRRQFGVRALDIYELAFGIDRRSWRPFIPPVRIQETQPLEPPIDNTEPLQFIARALADRISTSLLHQGLGSRALRITLSQEAARAVNVEVAFAYPVSTSNELFDGIRPRLLRASISSPIERITLRTTPTNSSAQP